MERPISLPHLLAKGDGSEGLEECEARRQVGVAWEAQLVRNTCFELVGTRNPNMFCSASKTGSLFISQNVPLE